MTDVHDGSPEPAPEEELFVELANTLHLDHDGRDEIADPTALRAWLAARGLPGANASESALEAALPAFRDLRTLLRELTERLADTGRLDADGVDALNRVLREGLHYHQLVPDADGASFSVGQVGDELATARASVAGSLAHYVADHDIARLRICGQEDCRWRFVDRSPAGRRRWCDMRTCGNRAKVARHRARRRAAEGISAAG